MLHRGLLAFVPLCQYVLAECSSSGCTWADIAVVMNNVHAMCNHRVQKLELGPNATATLTDIAQLMSTKVQEQQQQQQQQREEGEQGEEAASPAPKSKAEEAAGRAKELAEELLVSTRH